MLNRVLLVDDSRSARFALRKLLERSGLQVDVAESAEQALGYLDSHHPDLIFMDHFMPGMDGFEAARVIKSRPDKSGIPIVMCSSREGEGYAQEARENGAIDILPKPATPGAVTELLDNIARRIEQQQELAAETEIVQANETGPAEQRDTEMLQKEIAIESKQPLPSQKPMLPTLDDVVVPVDRIREIAVDSASQAVRQYSEQRIQELLESKVPQLREMVLSNFDKVAKLILQDSLGKELEKLKEQLKAEQPPVVQEAGGMAESDVNILVQAQIQQLYEKVQREVNEQLAEIYSSIGELKSNQHMKKIAPELMEDILARSRDTALEQTNDVLLQASEIAQKTAVQTAREVSAETAEQLREQLESKQAKALESSIEALRQESYQSAWKEAEQLTNQLKGKLGKLYLISGLSMAAAVLSLLGVIFLMR